MCFTTFQSVRGMMRDVLADLGRKDPIFLEKILLQLIPFESKPAGLEKLRRLFRESASIDDIRKRNAKKIAIQVASDLGIPWVLFYGLSNRESVISRQPKRRF
jgi:hypothetical protein